MAEYVPESPTSVASTDSWFSSLPFVEEEDVLVPYWELVEENLHRREYEVREALSADEQRLRDFWNNQHLLQRN